MGGFMSALFGGKDENLKQFESGSTARSVVSKPGQGRSTKIKPVIFSVQSCQGDAGRIITDFGSRNFRCEDLQPTEPEI